MTVTSATSTRGKFDYRTYNAATVASEDVNVIAVRQALGLIQQPLRINQTYPHDVPMTCRACRGQISRFELAAGTEKEYQVHVACRTLRVYPTLERNFWGRTYKASPLWKGIEKENLLEAIQRGVDMAEYIAARASKKSHLEALAGEEGVVIAVPDLAGAKASLNRATRLLRADSREDKAATRTLRAQVRRAKVTERRAKIRALRAKYPGMKWSDSMNLRGVDKLLA